MHFVVVCVLFWGQIVFCFGLCLNFYAFYLLCLFCLGCVCVLCFLLVGGHFIYLFFCVCVYVFCFGLCFVFGSFALICFFVFYFMFLFSGCVHKIVCHCFF